MLLIGLNQIQCASIRHLPALTEQAVSNATSRVSAPAPHLARMADMQSALLGWANCADESLRLPTVSMPNMARQDASNHHYPIDCLHHCYAHAILTMRSLGSDCEMLIQTSKGQCCAYALIKGAPVIRVLYQTLRQGLASAW